MLDNYPDVLTVQQTAEVLSISKQKVYELLKDGKLQSVKIGRINRIPKIKLLEFLGFAAKGA
ncbi:MAG: helix-turn-helix domain-containing protein [Lachnospiraceae bacterium]|nr:helix-turn-helix domain-containing protein [Lachnospiraceae bacterium]